MGQGPWILLLLAGVVLAARPLSRLLPRIATPPAGAGLGWRRMWMPLLVPMIATPLVLRVLPTHFLPVLVGDYLAAHFALYGLITAACLLWTRRTGVARPAPTVATGALLAATAAVIAYGFVALVWPINAFVTSFLPGPERALLILAMLAGTLLYFLADEWLTRGPRRGARRLRRVEARLPRLAGDRRLARFRAAVLPDHHPAGDRPVLPGLRPLQRLDLPRTGQPAVAGIANAVAFAWAIGVTFPLLAG